MQQERGHSIHRQLTRMNLTLVIATALMALVGTLVITVRMEFQTIGYYLYYPFSRRSYQRPSGDPVGHG